MAEPAAQPLAPARTALDLDYDLRAAVPEHPAHFARYREDSARCRAAFPLLADQHYGSLPRAAIDLFPAPAPGAPLYVFVHGGYWQAMDRKDFSFMARPFLEAGWAAAVLGYDLAPEVDLATITAQIRTALVWLHRRANSFRADPARMVIAGHSAGAHLAAMALATDWQGRFGLPQPLLAGACLISGVFDLEPVRHTYLNSVLGLGPVAARRLSPLQRLPRAPVPLSLTLGALETAGFHDQSRRYAAALQAAGFAPEVQVQPGHDHFSVVTAMAEPANPVTRRLLERHGLARAPARAQDAGANTATDDRP